MPEKHTKEDEILETLNGLVGAVGSRLDRVDGEIKGSRKDLTELKGDMDHQFSEVREQLDRIEHLILEEHARRLEALERKAGIAR
jgi:DNA-binding FrmR family transcriptional regulator